MSQLMRTLDFWVMSLGFKLRDLFTPPKAILDEVGIGPGLQVLDYGCGPGSHALVAAQLVGASAQEYLGASGRVYAVDINPLALRRVEKVAAKRSLTNIETILTDCATGLDADSVDVVLFYDTYHDLANPDAVLKELHRVLKPGALLSFSDHHMEHEQILSEMAKGGLFELSERGERTYTFVRRG